MKRTTITEGELRSLIHHMMTEMSEPFQDLRAGDIVSQLQKLNAELDKVAFSDDEKFDSAFEEITAAHTAIERLLGKLNKKVAPAPQRPVHAESRQRNGNKRQ